MQFSNVKCSISIDSFDKETSQYEKKRPKIESPDIKLENINYESVESEIHTIQSSNRDSFHTTKPIVLRKYRTAFKRADGSDNSVKSNIHNDPISLRDIESRPDKNYLATRRRARSMEEIHIMPKKLLNFIGEKRFEETYNNNQDNKSRFDSFANCNLIFAFFIKIYGNISSF